MSPPYSPFSASFFSFESNHFESVNGKDGDKLLYSDEGFNEGSSYEDAVNDEIEQFIISEHQWFQQLRQPLTTLLQERLQAFMNTVQYVVPLSHSKLPDASYSLDGLAVSTFLKNLGNDSAHKYKDDDFVLISPPKRHFHYSCPFEALYPKQYRQCLLQHNLLTMDDVVNHIKRYHVEALYCPMCSQIFDTLIHRDCHIIKRSCELQNIIFPNKVNAQQEATLTRAMKTKASDEERWNCIFTTIFPNMKAPLSPYLDHDSQLAISVAKDYFMIRGRHCVSEFLQTQGLDSVVAADKHAQAALYQLALNDLLDQIVERYEDIECK